MADNYLEKRMDDYRKGRLSGHRPSAYAKVKDRGGNELVTVFPPMRLLVASRTLSPLAAGVVRLARSLGLNVALMSDNRKDATALSQSVGARLYLSMSPEAVLADMAIHWGGTEVVFAEDDGFPECGCRVVRIRESGAGVDIAARFYMFMAHPDNSFFTIS